jgi:hypothetical protein
MSTLLELAESYPEIRPQAEELTGMTYFSEDDFRVSCHGYEAITRAHTILGGHPNGYRIRIYLK